MKTLLLALALFSGQSQVQNNSGGNNIQQSSGSNSSGTNIQFQVVNPDEYYKIVDKEKKQSNPLDGLRITGVRQVHEDGDTATIVSKDGKYVPVVWQAERWVPVSQANKNAPRGVLSGSSADTGSGLVITAVTRTEFEEPIFKDLDNFVYVSGRGTIKADGTLQLEPGVDQRRFLRLAVGTLWSEYTIMRDDRNAWKSKADALTNEVNRLKRIKKQQTKVTANAQKAAN